MSDGDSEKNTAKQKNYVDKIKYRTGPYAILRILWEHKDEETITKQEIIKFGQKYCNSILEPIVGMGDGSRHVGSTTIGFGAWSSRRTLITHELIEQRKCKTGDAYKLSKDGLKLVPGTNAETIGKNKCNDNNKNGIRRIRFEISGNCYTNKEISSRKINFDYFD